MSAWVKIGDVATIYDGPHATPPPCDKPGLYFLGIPHITSSGHLDLSEPRYIAENDYAKWTKRVTPRYGDVVFSYEATLNLYALIPDKFKCCLGRRMGLVRPNPERLDSQFLYYYFFSKKWRDLVKEKTISGATVERLPIASFPEFEIDLPPLPTQQRIASVLSDYDAAIANCRRQIALLEEAAQRLYREWFAEGKGEKWPSKTIGALCTDIGSGGTPKRNRSEYWEGGDIPWVKTAELQDCWLFDTDEKITKRGLAESAAKLFPAETIMMAIYASPTLGRLGIMGKPMSCNQATLCLIADQSQISWPWLYCKLYELRDHFNAIARGAGQQNISGIVVKSQDVRVPPKELIDKFTDQVKPMFLQQKELSRQIRTLTEARDRLLPMLMSGEVAV